MNAHSKALWLRELVSPIDYPPMQDRAICNLEAGHRPVPRDEVGAPRG